MEDIKDRDLLALEILDINSRESTSEISKKMHISKQAIISKISKLEKKGYCSFIPIIDYFKLGYHNLHVYLKLQGLNKEGYSKKISSLKDVKNITWIEEFLGEYDIAISIFFKSLEDLHRTLDKIYSSFRDSIKKKEIHFIRKQIVKNFSFGLVNEKTVVKLEDTEEINQLNQLDKKILDLIRLNGRFNYVNLSNKLKISPQKLMHRIKRLKEREIILQYKILLNFNKIGYIHYICIIDNVPGSEIKEVLKELETNSLIPFISITLENKIIFDFAVKDHDTLREFLDELKNKYPKIIDEFKILNVRNPIKLDYLIE